MPSLRIVGPGRAGMSLARALEARGWTVAVPVGRHDDPSRAAEGVDLCVVSTPDAAIERTAAAIDPVVDTVVGHLSGSLGLDALAPHPRRACLHPLVALPDPERGSRALVGAWFAVDGDVLARAAVADLGGTVIEITDDTRAAYHAAACVASNHLVALMAQVERIAAAAGVPLAAYLDLVRATVDNVADLGPAAALTGPAARGDWATIERHLRAIDPAEAPLYLTLARQTATLAGRTLPQLAEVAPCS